MSTASSAALRRWALWLSPWLLASLAGCGAGGTSVSDNGQSSAQWTWSLPAYFPVPRVPADNPMSVAKAELGRFLFYDKRLSGNGKQACASCHHQDKAFTDGLAVAVGSTGELHPRASQHLANSVYHPTLTWANPALVTLEAQMMVPLFSETPVELGINDANRPEVLARFAADADYVRRFAAAFPGEAAPINFTNIIKAIATFQRTLISGNAKYDQYLQGKAVLSDSETRGLNLFMGEKAECFHCHGSFNFNDQIVHAATRVLETPFSNTGLFNIGGTGAFPEPNRGLFESTGNPLDMGKFRAPSLRNVELTAPYMHDGSLANLEAVLDFYAAGGRLIESGPHAGDGRLTTPSKSEVIAQIDLTPQDKVDLIAFLKTLTDHEFINDPRFSNPFTTP
jgi:cytochrome c peroxidase